MSSHSLYKILQIPSIFHLRQPVLGCLLNKRVPCVTGKNDLSEVITKSRIQVTTSRHLCGPLLLYALLLPRVILGEGATYLTPKTHCSSTCVHFSVYYLRNVGGIGNCIIIESNVKIFCSHFKYFMYVYLCKVSTKEGAGIE